MYNEIIIENGFLYKDGLAYINIDTKDSLIAQIIRSTADDIYSFEIVANSANISAAVRKEFAGSYWIRASHFDKIKHKDYSIRENKSVSNF